jgi:hypothetical protein
LTLTLTIPSAGTVTTELLSPIVGTGPEVKPGPLTMPAVRLTGPLNPFELTIDTVKILDEFT